jgi:sulfite reductase alpha subunit-like flavoprotein
VLENTRLTSQQHWQDVRHVNLSITDAGFSFSPGDVCAVHPRNDPVAVAAFCARLVCSPESHFPSRALPFHRTNIYI